MSSFTPPSGRDESAAAQDHAETIRRLLPLWHVGGTQGDRVYAAVAAMEAEIKRLEAILWPPELKKACRG